MALTPPLPMPAAALEDWGRTLASLGIGASLVDRHLKLTWCNQLLQEQVDEGKGDGGEHCFAVHWSRKQRCSDCLPLLVFQTGEPHQGYRERHRPGQPRKMFRVGATPIRDPAGQVTHVMETFVDVTELGAAIVSARLEDRLSTSLAAAGHGVLVVDPRGRIVSWSTGMDAILGHRAIDVLGRGAASLLPGDAGGAAFWSQTHRELRELVAKDGRRVPVAVTPSSIGDDQGELCGYQVLVEDLSEVSRLRGELDERLRERDRFEQQMVRSEKLAAVGSLAAGLAHEIGTPLNVISASAEYALLDLPAHAPGRPEMVAVVEEVDRIRGLVSELLGFARGAQPSGGTTRPHEAVGRVLRLLKGSLDKHHVKVEADVGEDLPPVRAGSDVVHQLLLNVLMNAVAAVPDGGRISIRARVGVLPLLDRRSPSVDFSIGDDGPGIPAALRQRVLDPFFTTRQNGTGLGLTVCNRIVTDHGGAIHIGESVWGGALVELSLPISED